MGIGCRLRVAGTGYTTCNMDCGEGFLKNRQFSVRLGACLSGLFNQDVGVPQGSVLSVTLFALKINSIGKTISPGVECSLYVDDFLIVYRSENIHIIERHLQRSLSMFSHWADTNGFKFSRSKTVTVYAFLQTSQCSSKSRTHAQWYSHPCC